MEIKLPSHFYPDGSARPIMPATREQLVRSNLHEPIYTFTDTECLKDGEVIGSIISRSEIEFLVKCYDGNPHMAGHVLKFVIQS